MCTDKDISPCQHGDLITQVSRLEERNARQMATIRELQKRLAEAQRAGKRQAAPFSKGKRAAKPRRPGRKPGTGSFSFRKPPSHDELTEPITDVSVSAESCPGCGGVARTRGSGVCVCDRHSPDAQARGEGIQGTDMPLSVMRQEDSRSVIGKSPLTSMARALTEWEDE